MKKQVRASTSEGAGRFAAGTRIKCVPVGPIQSDSVAVAQAIKNWEFFNGAVLAVGVITPGSVVEVLGTAVLIAPGLAIGASHVLADRISDITEGHGSAVPFCTGIRDGSLDMWKIRSLNYEGKEPGDITFYSLELASESSEHWTFTSFVVSTRTPRVGEALTIVGFRAEKVEGTEEYFEVHGDLLSASGDVEAVHPHGRDSVLMPYPTIVLRCGSRGAMSGGAVLDEYGHLLGVVSRGLETEDGEGPTYAAWILPALNRELDIPWPPGLYRKPQHVLEIDPRLLRVHGRGAYRVTSATSHEYRIWFDASKPPTAWSTDPEGAPDESPNHRARPGAQGVANDLGEGSEIDE